MIEVRDVNKKNMDDIFRVCSRNKLEEPLQKKGICIKREWLIEMTEKYGTITKIAYYNNEPSAQLLYYPEDVLPYIRNPRSNVLIIECIYNSNPKAQGKGVATELLINLLSEAKKGIEGLEGKSPEFIVVNAFNTGEGITMEEFFLSKGFNKGKNELYYEIDGKYYPREKIKYQAREEDKDKSIVFFNRNCEYSYPFAIRIKKELKNIDPDLPIEIIDIWDKPNEMAIRGENLVIVNSKTIRSHIGNKEAFTREVKEALKAN
jgi:GNAT superfamily N-acetyltransferase